MKTNKIFILAMTCLMGTVSTHAANQNPVQLSSAKQAPKAEAEQHTEHGMNLPLHKRLAFMSGHVQAGLALYRAGESKMAAPHLLHPVSETHAAERVGLDALGFKGHLFEYVSNALEQDRRAGEIEPQLKAAEANLTEVTTKAGGDPKEIIDFLMDTILEEYAVGVTDNKVTDAGEYQDAFGFTLVALQHAKTLNNPELSDKLQNLLNTWPLAPIPPEHPASLQDIQAHIALIKKSIRG